MKTEMSVGLKAAGTLTGALLGGSALVTLYNSVGGARFFFGPNSGDDDDAFGLVALVIGGVGGGVLGYGLVAVSRP